LINIIAYFGLLFYILYLSTLKCQRNLKTKDQERSGKTLPQVDIKLVIPYTLGYMVKQKLHKHGEVNNKSVKLVNMASGSLSKVSTMILEKRYCPEVIQQIDSVIGLLKSTRSELLKGGEGQIEYLGYYCLDTGA
jgi:DNA-binding FrmR family transcriptional regulator